MRTMKIEIEMNELHEERSVQQNENQMKLNGARTMSTTKGEIGQFMNYSLLRTKFSLLFENVSAVL